MKSRQILELFRASVLLAGAFGALGAGAQEIVQALDQVKIHGSGTVMAMTFHDATRQDDYTPNPPALSSAEGLVSCTQTSAAGLTCLTATTEMVIRWTDPTDATSSVELFSCNAIDQLLDEKASNTCTGLTADEAGNIWLAGRNKSKSHTLVRVSAGACDDAAAPHQDVVSGTGETYCAETWDTGRPLLLQVKRVEGEIAENFDSPLPGGTGDVVLGLEQRLNAVLFNAANAAQFFEIPGGKTGWNLMPKEQLQDIALLQTGDDDEGYENYVLVTTNKGRVLAKDMSSVGTPAFEVWLETACQSGTVSHYAMAASPKGEVVYVGNSSCMDAVALSASKTESGQLDKLVRAVETIESGSALVDRVVPRLTTSPFGSEGITVAPGQDFKLADCTISEAAAQESPSCIKVPGVKVWSLDDFTSDEGKTGVTVLQILDLPDCRWIEQNIPDECANEDVYYRPGIQDPAGEYLNIKPLLPDEVVDVLEAKGILMEDLPDMLLIAPQHRAQDRFLRRFDALFFIVDKSVIFDGIFDALFDIKLLTGEDSQCADTVGVESANGTIGLDWDIVTRIAEQDRYVSVDRLHQDMLINTGCGSSRTSTIGLSIFSYPMEVTSDTVIEGKVFKNNDAVFARYLQKLWADMEYIRAEYACKDASSDGTQPISSINCSVLESSQQFAKLKLDRCIEATYQPKQSAGNQNCQSFEQQFDSYRQTLAGILASDASLPDPESRRNELELRRQVFLHVYQSRFLPSVPQGGFCREEYVRAGGQAETGCTTP